MDCIIDEGKTMEKNEAAREIEAAKKELERRAVEQRVRNTPIYRNLFV